MQRYFSLVSFSIFLLAPIAGCERGPGRAPEAQAPVVPVAHAVEALITNYVDYTGRTNAMNAVTIVPRVTGYLEKMPFKEGADVKKDQTLFIIDPRPYNAQLDAAKAAVAQNEASLGYAHATNERFKELAKKQPGAVSARELDQYQAQEEQAIANLNLAKANLVSANLNLEWTVVKSPIDGHVSRYYLTVGNLVNQDVTQLTTVVSMDPMYAYFDMDEPTLIGLKRAVNEGKVGLPRKEGDVSVMMGLAGEEGYPHKGTINFVDNQVNPSTGSIAVRGVFPNPKPDKGTYLLVPGMFVRIHLPIGQEQKQFLVLDRVVTSDQGNKYLYVLDANNTVQPRKVFVGPLQNDGMRVITGGLKKEDWVLVGSLQQVRPRMIVRPEYMTMPTLTVPATPLDKKDQGDKK